MLDFQRTTAIRRRLCSCGASLLIVLGAGEVSAQDSPAAIMRLPPAVYLPNVKSPGAPVENFPTQSAAIRDLGDLAASTGDIFKGAESPDAAKAAAQKFLDRNATELGVVGSVSEFRVVESRPTLSGQYVDLEQRVKGIKVINSGIQIKYAKDGSLQSVTRNVVAVPASKAGSISTSAKVRDSDAQQIAWNDLAVSGEFLEKPSVEKAYVSEENVLTLVYIVKLAVSEPFGYWEYTIDANTGRIVSKADRRVQESKLGLSHEASKSLRRRPALTLSSAVRAFETRASALEESLDRAKSTPPTSAPALIFVPNPISALVDRSLRDNDPPLRFQEAYRPVTLEGLTRVGGEFTLMGARVQILDFEPGDQRMNRPPSTSSSGWSAMRGDNAFNDVMTYFHIYNELVYLQKLGYVGARDLFPAGIAVDSDGLNGDDNSHYVPGSDRIAFGHGCVDDNEDTDVILHEFGHAIHYHLNSNWGGGDSGAIGEGFGDYWAVSRRMRMRNGLSVEPGKVFVWDGISDCWPGRRVDRNNARYNPALSYDDHQPMGAFISDELWSTPLVSSLLQLVGGGESAESVDIVVLAGMEGIGRNFTMRDLAKTTVEQARLLYPGRPHAATFEANFRAHNILEP